MSICDPKQYEISKEVYNGELERETTNPNKLRVSQFMPLFSDQEMIEIQMDLDKNEQLVD